MATLVRNRILTGSIVASKFMEGAFVSFQFPPRRSRNIHPARMGARTSSYWSDLTAQAHLDHHIPADFHGTWVPNAVDRA